MMSAGIRKISGGDDIFCFLCRPFEDKLTKLDNIYPNIIEIE